MARRKSSGAKKETSKTNKGIQAAKKAAERGWLKAEGVTKFNSVSGVYKRGGKRSKRGEDDD